MNQRVKELWVKALRSGKYRQTKSALHTDAGYCCLGVLCDLHALDTGNGSWRNYQNDEERSPEGKYFYTEEGSLAGGESDSFLTREVRKWAGLDYEDPLIRLDEDDEDDELESEKTLSALNDSNYSFRRIADKIERQL